ncbi:hypothetical protein EROM_050050 [Encephalitozoon romaleae SJ-2008]|uniref:Uncharacterized protein n=1 Tax=Encephalitozoon romaleae (strain SJ-2008) TaxID=1178016 RepID=I7AMK1_ENCRO|nr:hypothetical protein EROM_050050 [Encephalitozoon romaleae SJ-2008]AFN82939.1 hypothetical protein EROM_050050 [Encephalitozoon romaleae SJ-2008]
MFLSYSRMKICLHNLYFVLILMVFTLINCRGLHVHDLNSKSYRHDELRGWKHPEFRRGLYMDRTHVPVYGGRGIITLEDLKRPNVPVIVPYEVTPKQVLTLLRH